MQKIHQETLVRIQMQHEDKVRLLISWMPNKISNRLIAVTASEGEMELACKYLLDIYLTDCQTFMPLYSIKDSELLTTEHPK